MSIHAVSTLVLAGGGSSCSGLALEGPTAVPHCAPPSRHPAAIGERQLFVPHLILAPSTTHFEARTEDVIKMAANQVSIAIIGRFIVL